MSKKKKEKKGNRVRDEPGEIRESKKNRRTANATHAAKSARTTYTAVRAAQGRPSEPPVYRPIHRVRADNTLRGNEAIYAAVSRIANTVASMPLRLYRDNKIQWEHPLNTLVTRRPNVNFSAFGFVQTMEILRNTEGNAYALIVQDTFGRVERLDILDPTRVRPMRHPETREMWYSITLDDGKPYLVPGCIIIALKHMSGNGELGIRPIDVLRGSLDYDKQVKEIGLRQLDGVNQGVFLTVPGTALNQDARDKAINDFLSAYEDSGGRVVILEGGMTASAFSQSAIDPKVLDAERITRNRVATVYNIPPHLLGDYTDTSYSTAEQTMREFLQLTILPIAAQWEQELDRKLLTDADARAGYHFRFDVDELSRADTAAMANKYQMAIRSGWMRPNEVRQREHLPEDPHGGELMFSRDLLPARIAVEHPDMLLGVSGAGSAADGGARPGDTQRGGL